MSTKKDLENLKFIMNLLKHQLKIARQLEKNLREKAQLIKKTLDLYQRKSSSGELEKVRKEMSFLREKTNRLLCQLESMDKKIKNETIEKFNIPDIFWF
ncbi:MAG: hypothetical protein GF370_01580 [Candidatus Nealsonbacteria bacterium]|nr:hypothetical protein [Candidatus Nealsonbacteria bacterium]